MTNVSHNKPIYSVLGNLNPYMSFCVPTWGMSALERRGAIQVYNTSFDDESKALIIFDRRVYLDPDNKDKSHPYTS